MLQTGSLLEPQLFPVMVQGQNVARVRVNGESCIALLDNGLQINIMPSFVKTQSLKCRTSFRPSW